MTVNASYMRNDNALHASESEYECVTITTHATGVEEEEGSMYARRSLKSTTNRLGPYMRILPPSIPTPCQPENADTMQINDI